MLFHLPGRRTVNLICALLIQGRETSYAQQTAASSLPSHSDIRKLVLDASNYKIPPKNVQLWNYKIYGRLYINKRHHCEYHTGSTILFDRMALATPAIITSRWLFVQANVLGHSN